ncbi:MAG: protein of unknown function with transmembrane region [Candidatus Wolfebacteria bacterium GW2011_GWC1_43_10]|uniref:LamG-like jellyroll fold domain-containing protein n=1 Tax=Candidatus Wolfebacteria bacterium GW2011_GWC1_43_10 TaxID=1619011 RepID=A0A0G1CBQ5_9BACT|nr:MAG: protein of unknown function with transmembrane region [Candidatus Wolfebacteria bacterium GW2011_GWC1_43_10]
MAVASLLLAGATAAILGVIRHNFESKGNQIANALASDLFSNVGSFAESDWHNIYNLPKGSGNQYYLVSSSTAATVVSGQESVLSNNVAAGLVGHWKFDEATGDTAYDSSGNYNNGTLANGPTRTASSSCQVGNCLSFNGTTSYVSSTDSGSLDIAGNLTISVWVKWNSFKNYGLMVEKGPANGSVVAMNYAIWSYADNTIKGFIGNGSASNQTDYVSASVLTAGAWHLVNLVADGSNLSIYVDGTFRVSSTQTVTPAANAYPLYITAPTYTLDGLIDDVRVYNRTLSADEIKQLYQSSVYSRYFYTESASRDAGGNIESTYNANNDDPSTQKITSVVVWEEGRKNEIGGYLTRSRRNSVFWQQDWSGGSGQEGPISEVNDRYSSSTNITAGASLQITDKNSDGTLYSSTFDTQVSGGAVFNSILWRGDKPSGTNVKFQIASSNSSSGLGGGATGTIDTFYRYAWNDEIGWIDFGYAPGNVQVQDTQLVGYAYNDDVEEISLDCATSPAGDICVTSDYKVTRATSTGDLAGWAWNDEIGWISFCGGQQTADCPGTISYKVNVNLTTGYFSGWAWNDAIGWISFNCADAGLCGVADYKVAVAVASGWRYLGPDGTSLTFYVPTGSGIPSQITLKYHNNHRYSRYKIILSPDSGHTLTPTVDDAIINWSP